MRKILSLVLIILGSLIFANVGFAAEETASDETEELVPEEAEELTQEEFNYLLDIGLAEEEINSYPVTVAKQLVSENAILIDSVDGIETFYELPQKGEVGIQKAIPKSELKMSGTAYKVTSDKKGYNKFYMYGNFEWLKQPFYTLTDGMTIGFPTSSGFFLPMSGGAVKQFESKLLVDAQGNGKWVSYKSTKPAKWEPSGGVAAKYNIRGNTAKTKNKGYVGQYVYVQSNKHNTINVKFEYGHKRISGSPTFGIYPTGIGITLNSTTDIRTYGIVLKY